MASAKQAVLPLWGSPSSARTVHLIALGKFKELCDALVDADDARDEARFDEVTRQMHALMTHVDRFKRRRFEQWAKERERNRG